MALRSYQNYFNDGGLVNHNALNRLYNAQSVADRYSDTVETSYLNDVFNTKLTPQEEAVKRQWLATVGRNFARPGSTYDYDLNAFIKHNVVPYGARPDARNHLDDSGKKIWNHPTPSNGSLGSAERMLGLSRPVNDVGHWIDYSETGEDYKRANPIIREWMTNQRMRGIDGAYIASESNGWEPRRLQRYFDKTEPNYTLLDYRPYSLEEKLRRSDLPVEEPILSPEAAITGGVGGLGGLARYGMTKYIPYKEAIKSFAKGAYNNIREDAILDILGVPDIVGDVKDVGDYYRAGQGLRRLRGIR